MTRSISFSSAMIVALVLGAGAFLSTTPAAAAGGGNYCLSSSENGVDCSFTSLAQCEATASGGLGECNMVATGLAQRRGPYTFYGAHAAMRGRVR